MLSTAAESWRHGCLRLGYRSLRLLIPRILRVFPVTAHILKVLPIAKAQKWYLGGVAADQFSSVTKLA